MKNLLINISVYLFRILYVFIQTDKGTMDVINKLLNQEDLDRIKNILSDSNFPWYYHSSVAYDHEDFGSFDNPYNFQFVHSFYNGFAPNSNFIDLMSPILEKMDIKALVKIKANLVTRTDRIIEHQMHTDVVDMDCKTSIFYINSNNGYTKFEDGVVVNSEENKLITFDSSIKHTGTSCTDEKCRIVINFNYF